MDSKEKKDFKNREKREVERFRGSIAEYSFAEDTSAKKTSFIKNISIKGVCIVANRQIEVGTVLYLVIHLPGIDPPIDAVGQAVWQAGSAEFENNPGKYYDIGVAFVNLSDYNLNRLMRLLHIPKPYR